MSLNLPFYAFLILQGIIAKSELFSPMSSSASASSTSAIPKTEIIKFRRKIETYIIELCITHVAHSVLNRVKSCDLALLTGTFIADRHTTSFALNFLGAYAQKTYHAER